jgi:hypothetical protein
MQTQKFFSLSVGEVKPAAPPFGLFLPKKKKKKKKKNQA